MSDDDKVSFYKKQIELEKLIIQTAQDSVADVKNNVIKELIQSIARDSEKHASMLKTLVTMNTTVTPYIAEDLLDELKVNMKKHIELEAKAIETYSELLKTMESEQEKLLVKAIYNDELRHHSLLKKIYEIIIRDEAITESDMWNFLKEDYIPQF